MQLDAELVLRSRSDARPGARDQRRDRAQGPRSHDADPRHLRAARASRDGKLQVELAQLRYALPRLHREEHDDVAPHRRHRRPRPRRDEARDQPPPRARAHPPAREAARGARRAIAGCAAARAPSARCRSSRSVGYTNAGKSTLLNALTEGDALAENKLFATLDPISRRLRFPHEREVVITDTVGLHPRSAEGSGRGVPRHARGDGRRRSAAPRRRRGRSGSRSAASARSRASSTTSGSARSRGCSCSTSATSSPRSR